MSTEPRFAGKLKAIRREFWWIFRIARLAKVGVRHGAWSESSQAGGEKGGDVLETLIERELVGMVEPVAALATAESEG